MFNIFKKNTSKIIAPVSGEVMSITECGDTVFADKILGDGVIVLPDERSNLVVSPVNGKIVNIVDTSHAFGIESLDGIELLVHIGINTVELKGEGFESLVKLGDTVKAGQPLCNVSMSSIAEKGYSLQTPVVITNMEQAAKFEIHSGTAVSGETCIIEYVKR